MTIKWLRLVKISAYAVDNDCMSLRNEQYLRLAHNTRRSPADDDKGHGAGVAGVLVAAAMLTMLMVIMDHPTLPAGHSLRQIVARTFPGAAK